MNVKQMRLIMCVAILMLIPFNFSPLLSQTSPQFVLVEGGTFIMGSTENEKGRSKDEIRHKVRVNSFYLSRTEVTQGQYSSVMKTPPPSSENTLMPMQFVSWYEAVEFCNELSRKSGLIPFYNIVQNEVSFNFQSNGYRLPSEAEWEYACRAGTDTPFQSHQPMSTDLANYDGRSGFLFFKKGMCRGATIPVGTLAANSYELYDMHGNVYEWCSDWYADYPSFSVTDPLGPSSGDYRVNRGGSWYCSASLCRSAYRYDNSPDTRYSDLGFRLLRTP